jgi:hypothetical protein
VAEGADLSANSLFVIARKRNAYARRAEKIVHRSSACIGLVRSARFRARRPQGYSHPRPAPLLRLGRRSARREPAHDRQAPGTHLGSDDREVCSPRREPGEGGSGSGNKQSRGPDRRVVGERRSAEVTGKLARVIFDTAIDPPDGPEPDTRPRFFGHTVHLNDAGRADWPPGGLLGSRSDGTRVRGVVPAPR